MKAPELLLPAGTLDKMRTAYKKMDPATFAELMKSTLVMMRLAGRGASK